MRMEVTKSQQSKFPEVDSNSDFDGQVTFNLGGANNNAALELTRNAEWSLMMPTQYRIRKRK